MMDVDSQNITPPESPIIGYSGSRSLDKHLVIDSNVTFCLDCKGVRKTNDHSFSPEGYILRGEVITGIDSLSSRDGASTGPPRLFKWGRGNLFDPLDKEQLKIMTAICRKAISSLEILSESSNSYHSYDAYVVSAMDDPDEPRNQSPWVLRQRVCQFLNFVVRQLKYYRAAWKREDFESVFIGLKKSLGSTKEWRDVLKIHCGSAGGNQCSSPSYHFFHLQLELRWCLLLIFGLKENVIQWVLDDLIHLALSNYPNVGTLDSKQPFNCSCVNEIWVMIRLLLDELQPQQKSFWAHYGEAMQRCSKDNAFFPIWLTASLADIGNYSVTGVYTPGRGKENSLLNGNNGYNFLRGAFKEWVNRGGKSSEILKLSFGIFQQWGGDFEIVSSLWMQYVSKLNKGNDVTNFQPFSSIDNWLNIVYEICEDDTAQQSCRNESKESYLNSTSDSFFHYIRLVGSYVKSCNQKHFKRFTSNICMKLSSNSTNTNDFGELGIIRVTTLFMVLTHVCADVQEAVSLHRRLQDIFIFDKTKNTPGRKKSILRAYSIMLILLVQKKFNISEVATPYMRVVNELLCGSTSSTKSIGEPSKKDLIMIYIDLLDNVPKFTPSLSRDQNLGRSTLISPNFMMWLSNCGPNYAVRTASMLCNITKWILSWITSQSDFMTGVTASSLARVPSEAKDFLKIIQDKCLPYFRQCVTQNSNRIPTTDMNPVAKFAGDVTILIMKLSQSQSTDRDKDALFDLFATDQRTCSVVSQFYVKRLFKHKSFIEHSFTRVKWAQVWVRLIALDCPVPDDLTELILGTQFASTSNSELLKHFCKGEWSKEDLKQIAGQLPDLLTAIMNGTYFKEQDLRDSEQVISSVITSCVTLLKNIRFDLLYIRNYDTSIGHQLLNLLVPPSWPSVPPWEKWATPVLDSVEENLFNIFKSVVDSRGYAQDSFLLRKLQHIVVLAVLGFVRAVNEVDKDVHPAFTILNYCENEKVTLVQDDILPNVVAGDNVVNSEKLYQLFIRAVCMLRQKLFPTFVLRLGAGLIRIFLKYPNMERSAMAQCLNLIVYCVIFGNSGPDHKRLALEAFTKAMEKESFAFNSRRWFILCESVLKCNSADENKNRRAKAFVKTELLPIIIRNVEITEEKRGVGFDSSLRTPLEGLQNKLINI